MPQVRIPPALALLRWPGAWLAPAGARARLSILIYHRVLAQPDPLCPDEVDAATFRWQMALLARHFTVLPLMTALQQLHDNSLPARAVCITFDDGYADNADIALPILQQFALPATFFIATGYLNGGRMWNDTVIESLRRLPAGTLDLTDQGLGVYRLDSPAARARAIGQLLPMLKYRPAGEREAQARRLAARAPAPLPDDLMLTTQKLRTLHQAGMTIGAHTVTHPILAQLDTQEARQEITASKAELETLLQQPVRLFAYPNGKPERDYLPEHAAMAREAGFSAAVATHWGVSARTTDRWQLPRFTPWDATPARFMLRLLANCRQIAC